VEEAISIAAHPLSRRARVACRLMFTGAAICGISATSAGAADGAPRDPRWTLGSHALNDAVTGLHWTAADNGADIDWNHALAHCAARGDGWHLPTIDELRSIYVEKGADAARVKCGDSSCRTSPQLTLSGTWFWSSTPVGADAYDGAELAWGMSLVNGARTQSVKELSYGSRALCVQDGQRHSAP
jgi:hypothetical protein